MKQILSRLSGSALTILCIMMFCTSLNAETLKEHPYIDFSSDRSTYFFRLEGGDDQTVFFDFFSPFDPTVKVKAYDPLVRYQLEHKYYLDDNGVLMMHIEDLKKLYAPYFSYEIEEGKLFIRHTVYDKLMIDGFGERSTTLEYTKKVWDLEISLEEGSNSGEYAYTEYLPTIGGRNKDEIADTEINSENSMPSRAFTFAEGKIQLVDGQCYVPIADLMTLMGKISSEEEGYLAIQQENLADVTMQVERLETVDEVVIPRASNVWNPGSVESVDPEYTWADYMNDVADGNRKTGWLWQAFYIPSGSYFKDRNGEEVALEADRIVPFNIYVPSTYDEETTRLTYMLHGGTGNENAPTHRAINRDVNIDQYAEEYNYIIVSPNGWTQNPIWREGQALYSFEKSFEMVMEAFPVKENQIFISGNSLGGRGTLELAMRFPNRFRAMTASAPKIADKASSGKGTVISIEDTVYDLADIKDLPALIIQGTADTTTSFKTQLGSEESPGSIAKAVMPKLENAVYMTIEEGNHTYSYATAIRTMFDFFESTLEPAEGGIQLTTLQLGKGSKTALLDHAKYKLKNPVQMVDGVMMMALEDLEDIYGEQFKVYAIHSYDASPSLSVDYYTVIYGNKTLNFMSDEKVYRKNMERYKQDAANKKSSAASDESLLEEAPQFAAAPYMQDGKIYVPVEEVLNALELDTQVSQMPVMSHMKLIILISLAVIAVSGTAIVRWKLKK